MADRNRFRWLIFGLGLVLTGCQVLAGSRRILAEGGDMKGELVSLAIVQGYVDLPVNGQNPFLWKVKEFASKHGFEFHLMELPGNNKAYSAMLIRDDLLLDCTSETVSAMEGFDPLRYGFAFHRNVFKHNKLESDDPYRPEVDRLVTDFQVMMKPVGAVTITPSKSK